MAGARPHPGADRSSPGLPFECRRGGKRETGCPQLNRGQTRPLQTRCHPALHPVLRADCREMIPQRLSYAQRKESRIVSSWIMYWYLSRLGA